MSSRLSYFAVAVFVVGVARTAQAVPVHFSVEVPYCTPIGSTVLLRSNRLTAAAYQHDALTRTSPTHWEGTFDVATDFGAFRYKYSHATCDATVCPGIEKDITYTGSGGEIADRALPSGATSTNDLVYVWRSALAIVDSSGNVTGTRPSSADVAFCAPYLSVGDVDGTIAISYDAYNAGDVALELGPTTAYGTRMMNSGTNRNHFLLRGLTPGAEYHYRIVENGVAGPDYTFRAPPSPGDEMRFAFIGDTQYYVEQQRQDFGQIAHQVQTFDPHVILSPGDMVASEPGPGGPGGWMYPEMGRWNVFFGIAETLMHRAPWMAAMGNHEEDGAYFYDVFAFPHPDAPRIDHYFFRVGNVHFTVLYTGTTDGYNLGGILDSQTAWMERVLGDADLDPDVHFKVVVLHRGPLSEGSVHQADGEAFWDTMPSGLSSWHGLWERNRVDLVLAGHNHNFTLAELNGVHYVTSCGGAPVHDLLSPPWASTTIHAEQTCSADLFTARAHTITFEPHRTDGSAIAEAALTLCHVDSDCSEAPSACPEATRWSCTRAACVPTCVAPFDAGMITAPPDAGASDGGSRDSGTGTVGSDGGLLADTGTVDAGASDAAHDALDSGARTGHDAAGRDAGATPQPHRNGCACRTTVGTRDDGPVRLLSLLALLLVIVSRRPGRFTAACRTRS